MSNEKLTLIIVATIVIGHILFKLEKPPSLRVVMFL